MPFNLCVKPDRNDPNPLVIYHGRSCPDGFAAALAAWLFFDGKAEFLALDHGDVKTVDDLPALAGRAVYILDFSFAEHILRGVEDRAAKLVMLDHHLSAAEKLTGFKCRCGVVHFDMKKSGARLAWEFFHPKSPVPELVKFVEDRDIWVWQYPQSAGFLAALDMEPLDFAGWHAIANFGAAEMAAYIDRGRAMDEKFTKLAQAMAEAAQPVTFNGMTGLMANVPSAFHSLVGDLLCQQSGSFALLWTVDKPGVVKCGLRSRSGFNCITLAESMGGGGHAQACGFKMPYARLPELLSGTFTAGQP
ncbi:MAG: phosphoesterase [Comamonadaceae bacterium CG_4_9_14_0_8_um_filter_60_18]|nr:MAG: phosphoesterase [Comamonadaceae bacterium CG2_30_60_41]PJC15968.1 MAG: phosphoesterase [Comamonadaceae bacterium CG_4_9_14_0_8_um_filter_60_18]